MRQYIFLKEINDTVLDSIKKEFKRVFRVDLDDKKYNNYTDIVGKWNAITKDAFSEDPEKIDLDKYIDAMYVLLYGCSHENGVVTPEVEKNWKKQMIEMFRQYTVRMRQMTNHYSTYNADVWINAYLSILYIKASDKNFYVDKKRDKYFCQEYVKKVLNRNNVEVSKVPLSGDKKEAYADNQSGTGFTGNDKRVELSFQDSKRYFRWSRNKIMELERCKSFQVEDRAFFHKSINGILIRHLTDVMIATGLSPDVEDYLYLLDSLCTLKSLTWQNLIGCACLAINQNQRELMAFGVWDDIMSLYAGWFLSTEMINGRLLLLTQALVYVKYQEDMKFADLTQMEKQCQDSLNMLEKNPVVFTGETERRIAAEWKKQERTGKLSARIKKNDENYGWIYAVMQRHVISSLMPGKCNQILKEEKGYVRNEFSAVRHSGKRQAQKYGCSDTKAPEYF